MAELIGVYNYLRHRKHFPTVWCSGCGIGTITGGIMRAVNRVGYSKDDVALISGIGCSSRMPIYADFNTIHTTHGRALGFATGVKLANPNLNVIVVSGDGDGLAIGGNHFIHAARRNMGITFILINNYIYGMTGGQVSPTTPLDAYAYTAPYGSIDPPFDGVKLAMGAGASYIARTTTYHVTQMIKYIEEALQHKGFAFVEVMSQCPVIFGRLNGRKSPVQMLQWFKEHAIPQAKYDALPDEKKEGMIPTGVFRNEKRAEYSDKYFDMVNKIRQQQNAEKFDASQTAIFKKESKK